MMISQEEIKKEFQIKTKNALKAVLEEGENWENESLRLLKIYQN